MAGKIVSTTLQINDHATATNNFVLKADNAGGVKLSRGNDGATTQDILSVDASGNLGNLSLPMFACRAWVQFNGTRNVTDTGASTNGQPVLIKGSGNVTSVTKNSTGQFTVNFTTAMPDTNYVANTAAFNSVSSDYSAIGSMATSSVSVLTFQTSGAFIDTVAYVSVFR